MIGETELRKVAKRVAEEAAALLREMSCDERYTAKLGGERIAADVIAEDHILDALKREGLSVRGISEERGSFGSGEIWAVIDPLDGSTNYSACIPLASVSIAFANGPALSNVIAGAVAPVFRGETFSFARGKGCFLGEEPMRRRPSEIAFMYIEDPVIAYAALNRFWDVFPNGKVRSLGSAALEICYVASGAALFVDARERLRNVDIAAAVGILRECGGEAFGSSGPIDHTIEEVSTVGDVVASLDKRLADEIVRAIERARAVKG